MTSPIESAINQRAYFAAHALQGLIAGEHDPSPPPILANIAVRYADALIAELAKDGVRG